MFRFSKNNKLNLLSVFNEAKHTYDDVPHIKRKRSIALAYRLLKYFSVTVIVFLLAFLIITVLYLNEFREFYNLALEGKRNIERSVEFILAGKYTDGSAEALKAEENFREAVAISDKYKNNVLLKNVKYFRLQLDDLAYLLHSAETISRAISSSANFAETLEKILVKKDNNFNKLNIEDKKKLLEILYASSPELTGIKANIDLAIINLNNISYSGILLPFKPKISEIEKQLEKIGDGLEFIIPLSSFVPVVLGYPEKANFLLLLQNSDELRPTGGFIGTYGILQTEYGDITRLDTHDIYHLDMPVKDTFSKEPPAQLKKYLGVDKWYMRDANWSPDFPSSARQIDWFYHEEDKLLPAKDQINNFNGKFDGIIAVTPKLITNILTLTGPVKVGGQEFNEHNFVELLQYKVEQEYIIMGGSSWHRKAVIGEIVKELKIKLFDLSPAEMYKVLDVFNLAFDEKNILLYFSDPGFQDLAMDKNWTGEIKQTKGDFLMVVDANMASYKTDAVMNKSINYVVSEDLDKRLTASLSLNYSHNGGFDWKTTRYRTYTRVYVPRGSQLINIEGADKNEKVDVYDEYGKTVFAFFLSIEPGSMGNVRIKYRLAKSVEEMIASSEYSLYLQKQAGRKTAEISIGVNFASTIIDYQPTGFFAIKQDKKTLKWETDFNSDRFFSVKLKN